MAVPAFEIGRQLKPEVKVRKDPVGGPNGIGRTPPSELVVDLFA